MAVLPHKDDPEGGVGFSREPEDAADLLSALGALDRLSLE
jgi:hypothetical protein